MTVEKENKGELEYKYKDIEAFHKTNATLAKMIIDYDTPPVPTVIRSDEYIELKAGCKFLQKTRKLIVDAKKEKTEEWRLKTKAVNGEGDRIIAIIEGLEAPWKAEKKKIDDKVELERLARIDKLQGKIDDLYKFIEEAKDASSEKITELIDCVDSIDTTEDFFDLTKEAGEARLDILTKLGSMLISRMEFEQSETDRIAAEKLAEESARQVKLEKDKAELESRINKLKMIPMDFIGKSSKEIKTKIDSLNGFEVTEDEFHERTSEVVDIKERTVEQLNAMHAQAITLEAVEAEKVAGAEKQTTIAETSTENAKTQQTESKTVALSDANEDWTQDRSVLKIYFSELVNISLPILKTEQAKKIASDIQEELQDLMDDYT